MIDKDIFNIASNTLNYGFLENHSHKSSLKSSVCGDSIKIYLKVRKDKIIKLKYEGNFCIYCNASASLLAEKSKNRSIKDTLIFLKNSASLFNNQDNFKKGNWTSFKKIMNKRNLSRKECLLLPLKTLLKALNN